MTALSIKQLKQQELYSAQLYYDALDRAIREWGYLMDEAKMQAYYRRRYRIWCEIENLKADLEVENLFEEL